MNTPKVLVSDDQELWREDVLATLLRNDGYQVTTADSISATLNLLDREYFHVVTADICFSLIDHTNIDGVQTIRKVASLDEGTSAIVLTGYGTVELAVQALKDYRVFNFMEKGEGFDQQRLLETVREAVQAAQIAHVNRHGILQFESVIPKVDLLSISSRLQLKQPTLRWVLMNLLQQVSPGALDPAPAVFQQPSEGTILQRKFWSRLLGRRLVICVGRSDTISQFMRLQPECLGKAEMDDATGVLLPDA